MPVGGMWGSALLDISPDFFQVVNSPFNGEKTVAVKALVPDWAIVHVQEADEFGNARIIGSQFQDRLLARAAKMTIITAERIIDTGVFRANPEFCTIPHFLVAAVVEAPNGARPGICFGEYESVDAAGMKRYAGAVKDGKLGEYLAECRKGRAR
jgi:glutaconate CoA-transferase subunit A